MRISSLQAGVAFLLGALTLTLWPQPTEWAMQSAAAQDPFGGAGLGAGGLPGAAQAVPGGESPRDSQTTVEKKLQQTLDVHFQDMPLNDVLSYFSEALGVQFYVDRRKCEDAGVDVDIQLTLELKQIQSATALELLLHEHGLDYMVQDGLIIVSSEEALAAKREVRVYNCRDLLQQLATQSSPEAPAGVPPMPQPGASSSRALIPNHVLAQLGAGGFSGAGAAVGACGGTMGPGGPPQTAEELRADKLTSLVELSVEPDSWESNGGQATIAEFAGLLVVGNHARAHAKIERLLEMLRRASDSQPGTIARENATDSAPPHVLLGEELKRQ